MLGTTALRPLRALPLLRQLPGRGGARCLAMAGGGSAASATYPKPTVFPPVGPHTSTLIMLHGLGGRPREEPLAACSRSG